MKTLLLAALSFASCFISAYADDYSLVEAGKEKNPVSWSDLSNWSNRTAQAMAVALPTAADNLRGNAYVSLDGAYSIGKFTDYYSYLHVFRADNAVGDVSLTLNIQMGSGAYQRIKAYNGVRLVIAESASYNGANGDAGPSMVNVVDGGTIDVYGAVNSRHTFWTVENGGTLNYAPKSYSTGTWQENHYDSFDISGTLNFPNGLNVIGGDKSAVRINHNSGSVNFGGGFSSVAPFIYSWKGGVLSATENLDLPDSFDMDIAANASVSAVVAEGKKLSISNITFADGVSFTKSGDGVLVLPTASYPAVLHLNEGVLNIRSPQVPSLVFGGGILELQAHEGVMPKIASLSVAEGEKAKIKLTNLYLLPVGEYTVVEAGNSLATEGYEFELDPSVIATTAVKNDGSVVLTVSGITADLNPLVWRPESVSAEWDAETAAWTQGETRMMFTDGASVLFDGEEEHYVEEIFVDGSPSVKSITFDGGKDYLLSGGKIETLYVEKRGSGRLAIDGNGFLCRNIRLGGGEFQLQSASKSYAEEGFSLSVTDNAEVSLSLAKSSSRYARVNLFSFEYVSGSTSWESRTEYSTKITTDTIADFIDKASPLAPDGTSLSGRSVLVSGYFHVNEEDAGEWSFKGIYDDGIALWVDGKKLFQTTNYTDEKTAGINLDEGWHEFTVRAYDGSGGWGHASCLKAKSPNAADYANFHEKNFNMDWRGSEIDMTKPLDGIVVDLSVGSNAKLRFRSAGYVLRGLDLADGATLEIDIHSVPANRTFVVIEDDATRSIVKELIQSSLGSLGTVVETSDGLAWEMDAVFESDTVTDLMDRDGWMIGVVPGTEEDITINGASTKAVMGEHTIAFNSISLANGATLTVNAERELPKLSLAAGTMLSIERNSQTMVELSLPGFVTKDEVQVGKMNPSGSISDITDISGLIGGRNWGASYKGIPYAVVEVREMDESSKLSVQFKHYEKPYMKGVVVELRKDDEGYVWVKGVKAAFKETGEEDFTIDFSDPILTGNDPATSDDTTPYGVKNLTFKVPAFSAVGVTVVAAGDFATTGEGAATVHVEQGCVLDLSGVKVSTGSKLVKTGAGTILFGDEAPSTVEISEGIAAFKPYVEYDVSGVSIGENVSTKVFIGGRYESAVPLARDDKTLYVAKYTYCGVGSWNKPSNWAGGELPGAGDAVYVHADGTKLTLDEAEVALPSSVTVEDGASFAVLASVTIPELNLAPKAKFAIGDNETKPLLEVTMPSAPNAAYSLDGEEVLIPYFMVATNATLKFAADAKLKNLDMVLCGKVTTTEENVGGIVFGHALDGETSYFALYAAGATIHPLSFERAHCIGHYVYPDVGGRVVQLRPYYFRECSFPCSGWYDYTNPNIGVNNPLDEPCELVFDKTHFYYNQWVYVGGCAKVRCINGASFQRQYGIGHIGTGGGPARIEGSASIELEGEGSYFAGYGQSARFAFKPSAEAVLEIPTLTLKDGASIKGFHLEGNGEASLYIVNDGEWTIPKLYLYESNYQFSPVLQGFDAAIVEEDSVFRIVGRNEGVCNTGSWHEWDRRLTVDAGIGGYGDVLVTNAVAGNSMEIIVTSPLNTCEGAIRCEGANNCSLLFADGANWAGTVVAGNVSLTNLNESARAASVDFGRLDLSADFPVRVWRGADGTLANDTLNVGAYLNNGGRIAPVMMTEGDAFAFGDKIVLGKVRKGAPLPHVAWGWTATAEEIEGDGDHVQLILARGRGFMIIVR